MRSPFSVLLISLSGVYLAFLGLRSNANNSPEKMAGVCWVGGDSITSHNISELEKYHVNWISQTPFGWQPRYNDPELHFDEGGWYWGERRIGIEHTARLAREQGIRSVLKPHIWLRRSGDKWRSDIEMQSDEDWDLWFENYSNFILYYAQIAQESQIELLCIGTELYHPSTKFPDRWREIVADIRKVYHGHLTYAANFYQEYEEITWWDALDYIGIQGYFPLSDQLKPQLPALKQGWAPHLRAMGKVAREYDRPVIFTELGYRNDGAAAMEPWLWPSQVDADQVGLDDGLQADCYRAFFDVCWKQDWIVGVFFWKWFHSTWRYETYEEYQAYRQQRRDSLIAVGAANARYLRRREIVFTPQGREALDVMRKNFGESSQ